MSLFVTILTRIKSILLSAFIKSIGRGEPYIAIIICEGTGTVGTLQWVYWYSGYNGRVGTIVHWYSGYSLVSILLLVERV